MKLVPSQKEKFCHFLYTTLIGIGKMCPEIVERNDAVFLKTNDTVVLSSTSKSITSPYQEVIDTMFSEPSDLVDEDEYIIPVQLLDLLSAFMKKGKIIRLNHIGFCYKTPNVHESIKRICEISKENALHTYQLKSYDGVPWIFTGIAKAWREPMLEFLPIKNTFISRDMDYWIPGIHINIDTTLTYEEIKDSVEVVLQGLRAVIPNYFAGFISYARVWVGVVSGINIHIDIQTFAQNTRFARKVLFNPLH